jgi:hypothetical protein
MMPVDVEVLRYFINTVDLLIKLLKYDIFSIVTKQCFPDFQTCMYIPMDINVLIMGWSILLRLYYNEKMITTTYVRNLSCLYYT